MQRLEGLYENEEEDLAHPSPGRRLLTKRCGGGEEGDDESVPREEG